MTEVSAEVKEFIYLLTLQFSKFRGILHMQFIICMQLGEKIKSAKKETTYFCSREVLHFHLFKLNVRSVTA
jgi:hypothetical protein